MPQSVKCAMTSRPHAHGSVSSYATVMETTFELSLLPSPSFIKTAPSADVLISSFPPCQPSPYESRMFTVCEPFVRHTAFTC